MADASRRSIGKGIARGIKFLVTRELEKRAAAEEDAARKAEYQQMLEVIQGMEGEEEPTPRAAPTPAQQAPAKGVQQPAPIEPAPLEGAAPTEEPALLEGAAPQPRQRRMSEADAKFILATQTRIPKEDKQLMEEAIEASAAKQRVGDIAPGIAEVTGISEDLLVKNKDVAGMMGMIKTLTQATKESTQVFARNSTDAEGQPIVSFDMVNKTTGTLEHIGQIRGDVKEGQLAVITTQPSPRNPNQMITTVTYGTAADVMAREQLKRAVDEDRILSRREEGMYRALNSIGRILELNPREAVLGTAGRAVSLVESFTTQLSNLATMFGLPPAGEMPDWDQIPVSKRIAGLTGRRRVQAHALAETLARFRFPGSEQSRRSHYKEQLELLVPLLAGGSPTQIQSSMREIAADMVEDVNRLRKRDELPEVTRDDIFKNVSRANLIFGPAPGTGGVIPGVGRKTIKLQDGSEVEVITIEELENAAGVR